MAARTDISPRTHVASRGLVACVLIGCVAVIAPLRLAAQPQRDAAESEDDDAAAESEAASGWAIEEARFRFTFVDQHGRGYQSADGHEGEPGSERAVIAQPQLWTRIRQNERVVHEVAVPIDIVSSASVDAIDAMSSASRVNEAIGLEVETRYAATDDRELRGRFGGHVEEQMRSFSTGFVWAEQIAERNAVLTASANAIADFIRNYTPDGRKKGSIQRTALNANLSASQLLSPTTVFYATYGLTLQFGDLETPWNVVPSESTEAPLKERFPAHRVRHAWTAKLAQYVPLTHTALSADYRFYRDSFDTSAHTVAFALQQSLGPSFRLRGNLRFHNQTGVSFFYEQAPLDLQPDAYRTSDSDLSRFDAFEWGTQLVWALDSPTRAGADGPYLDLAFWEYVRTNDFRAHVISVGLASQF